MQQDYCDVDGETTTLRKKWDEFRALSDLERIENKPTIENEITRAIDHHYKSKLMKVTEQRSMLHERNRAMTVNQENMLVSLCKILSSGGLMIEKKMLKQLIEIVTFNGVDAREDCRVSTSVVDGFMKRHENEIDFAKSSGIDPLRAEQMTEEVRDLWFQKMDNFIKELFELKLVPWRSMAEVPAANEYNMDELASDTTKRRDKVVIDVRRRASRQLTITPEGDKS